ncbi:MAG: OadG family transporter subunit [Bacteroidales bacterium]
MKRKIVHSLIFIGFLLCSTIIFAQKPSDLRINEIMTINTNNYENNFGERSAWIEVFNPSYGSVNIGGCYLSDDIGHLTKYAIPKGDILTLIRPRQHLIFWADNNPTHGTFHLNFNLDSVGFLVLTSSDGRTIIDSVSFSIQKENTSYARIEDGTGDWSLEERPTPSTNNKLLALEAANKRFLRYDPSGIAMALTAMSVVFAALFSLFLIFRTLGILLNFSPKKKKSAKKTLTNASRVDGNEVCAAIVMAMEMYQREVSELESNILTINRASKAYSPWSSKLYGLRQNPIKK